MNRKINILHLEDDKNDAELIHTVLTDGGLKLNYIRVNCEKDYLYNLREKKFDIILSDYTIPGYDGITGLKRARAIQPDTPFIFISGTLGEEFAIEMLKEGASDYVLKTHIKRIVPSIRRSLKESIEKEEYKLAQERLKKSEEQYRQIVETAQEGIWTIDENHLTNFVNNKMCDILEYTRAEMMDKQVFDFMDDEGKAIAFRNIEEQKTKIQSTHIFKYITKSGRIIWANISTNPIFDDKGKYKGALAMVADITKEKEDRIEFEATQEKLKNNEERYRYLFESNPLPMWIYDVVSTRFIEVNNEAVIHYGYSKEEFLTMKISDIRPPEEAVRLKNLLTGKTLIREKSGVWKHKTKAGKLIDVEITSHSLLMDESKNYRVVLANDITERLVNEEKVKVALTEKEMLLKEIHHRVKNNLQIISSLLKMQSAKIKDNNVREMFKDTQNRVMSMSFIHQSFYKSTNLSEIDFGIYIQKLIANLFNIYGIEKNSISLNMETNNINMGIDTAIPCGLLINEIVSNSLKYAFSKETKGEIRILLNQDRENYQLTVRDNGTGLPGDVNFDSAETLGMFLIKTLSRQIEGTLKLNGSNGTEYNITFPVGEYHNRLKSVEV